MTGTVTSYTPSTQALVINVTSITGSGTSTDWRIGSLEARVGVFADRDPVTLAAKGGLVEGGATNLILNSDLALNFVLITGSASRTTDLTKVAPNGSAGVSKFTVTSGTTIRFSSVGAVSGFWTASFWLMAASSFSIEIGDSANKPVAAQPTLTRVSFTDVQAVTGIPFFDINFSVAGDYYIFGVQYENTAAASSYIPTTTVAVTRAADLLNVDGTRFGQMYNSSQGTLVLEMTPIASAISAVAGSLNDGTLNNAIRVQQKQSGTLGSIRKMATDGVTDVMAINAATGNTLRSNGVDYTEVSDQSVQARLGVASSGVGKFLNVGATENFRSSDDSGATYNARTIGRTFQGAHFGIGRFVIAGSTAIINGATVGSVIVSTDGLSFRRVNIPGLTQNLNDVVSNGTNQYVAVGNGGAIYTSANADTWVAQTSGTALNIIGADFGTVGGTAYYYTAGDGNGSVRRSTDGITWNALTVDNVAYLDIAIGNGQIVLCRSGGNGYYSLNGTTFTASASLGNVSGAVYSTALGLWIAVGPVGRIVTATDPSGTWTTQTSGTTQNLTEVQLFGSTIVAVGAGQTILTSTDAVTWTARTSNVTGNLEGIAASGTRLLICGTNGAITTSEDGVTFTSRTGNVTQLNGAAFGAGTYVIVGNAVNGSGLIATVDPVTFAYQRRVSGIAGTLISVQFLGGAFYASALASIQRSTDGVTWTTQAVGGTSTAWNGVATNGSTLVAIGSAGRYTTSTDGLTWINAAATGVTGQQLNGIDFANGLFVAVGGAGAIITSPNGTTWTLRTSGTTANLFSVMYSQRDAMWYAAGDGGTILRSTDAITWENISNDAVGAVINNGNVRANPPLPNLVVGQKNRVAVRLKANDFAVSVNGAAPVKDTSVSLPIVDRLSIGMNGVSGQQFNGWISSIEFYTNAKSDTFLTNASKL